MGFRKAFRGGSQFAQCFSFFRSRSNTEGDVTIGQARKLIQGNSISVNGKKIANTEERLERPMRFMGNIFLSRKGKKRIICLSADII